MTEDRSEDTGKPGEDAHEATPEPGAGAPQPDRPRIPDLLPTGFRTAGGERTRLDAVTLARSDRDDALRRQRRTRQKARDEARSSRRKLSARVERLEKVHAALLVASVVAAPLLIGGVHLVTIIPMALCATLAATCAVAISQLRGEPFRAGVLGWTLLALSAWTFIQALPLPLGLVGLLSPHADLVRAAFTSVGEVPSTASLSLNPGEAARAGFGLLAAAAVYLAAYNSLRRKEKFQKMLLAIPIVGVALVLIGVVQKVLGAEALLGFYRPRDLEALPFFSATFVNPGHLATLLGMASFVPLSLSLSNDFKPQRGGLVLMFAVCAAGMVMTLSLPTVAAWAVGLLTFAALTLKRRFSSAPGLTAVILAAMGAVGIGTWAAWDQLAGRLSFLTERQGLTVYRPSALWAEGWSLALEHPWLGLGRGSFSDAFVAREHTDLPGRFDFVSNFYLQVALDYGLPVALLTVGAIGAAVLSMGTRRGWKNEDLPVMTGLFAAFVFLGVEVAGSFSLEIPGVLLPVVFLLALARGRDAHYRDYLARGLMRRRRQGQDDGDGEDQGGEGQDDGVEAQRRSQQRRERAQMPTWRRWAPLGVLALAGALSVASLPAAIDGATGGPNHALRQEATSAHPDEGRLLELGRRVLARRPAHAPHHLTLAIGFEGLGQPDKARVALEQARRFNQHDPAPWLLTARGHVARKEGPQAIEAYHKALTMALATRGQGREAMALEVSLVFVEADDVARALPEDAALWEGLLETLLSEGKAARALALADALGAVATGEEARRVTAVAAARAEAALGRWAQARQRAERLLAPPPGSPRAHEVLARAALHLEGPVAAQARAAEGLRLHPGDTGLLFAAAEVQIEHHTRLSEGGSERDGFERAETLLRTLRPHAISQPGLRRRFYRLSALLAIERGLVPTALRDLRRSLELDPTDADLTFKLARLLEEDRQNAEAIETYRRALERFPDAPGALEAAGRLAALEKYEETRQRFRHAAPAADRP